MNIFIRVDVHPKIGVGHVMRCLKMLSYCEDTANCTFISKRYKNLESNDMLNEMYRKIARNHTINYIDIEDDSHIDENDMTTWLAEPYMKDCKKTIGFLDIDSILIIDHYGIDRKWETAVRDHIGKVIVIDDFIGRTHCSDIIINCMATDRTMYDGLVNPNCELLLGMEYALIGKEFFIQDISKREKCRISVFVSGSDITDETSKIIRHCKGINRRNNNKFTFDVIVGRLNDKCLSIRKFCEENEKFNFFHDIDNMAEVLNRSYISIGALGQSLLERIALGIPSIALAISDNQTNLIDTLAKSETFTFLGTLPLHYDKILEEAINGLYNVDTYEERRTKCKKFIRNIGIHKVFKELHRLHLMKTSPDPIRFEEYTIEKNEFGYYEVTNKPSEAELNKLYSQELYQDPSKHTDSYSIQYCPEELTYIENKSKKIYEVVKDVKMKSVLDLGCGEGYVSRFFLDSGYQCKSLDYSDFGLKNHNPSVGECFVRGDIFENINDIIANNEKFGIVILNNVIEHVIDPRGILLKLKKMLAEDGVLVMTAPNDFSDLQSHLLEKNMIPRKNWLCPPMHISYFGLQSLSNLSEYCDYEVYDYYAEYPIDFDLLVEHTNYVSNKGVGKHSHLKRLRVDNFLCSQSIPKTNTYYKSLADLGAGRDIVMFVKHRRR
jgi:UDP-2,4-diacetamido-2,4,6-trideoxy-beta-L-altropyranose hydrolase